MRVAQLRPLLAVLALLLVLSSVRSVMASTQPTAAPTGQTVARPPAGDPDCAALMAAETVANAAAIAECAPASNPIEPSTFPQVPFVPQAVLYNNGPFVNQPGAAPGGADGSVLEAGTLGMNTLGFGNQISAGNRMADDFTITDPAGWQINTVTFYAYQTGSTTTSTITDVRLQIWNGNPSTAGSTVVFGDTTTNRLASTVWSNAYRYSDTTPGTTRPIMANTVTVNTTLAPGTYWLDWTTGGTLASGPWAPPITITGQTTTGNALQYTTTAAAWGPANDTGTNTQQGMPFIIEGDLGATATPTVLPTETATATTVPPTLTVTPPPTSIEMGNFANDGSPMGGWLIAFGGLALVALGLIARRR